MPTKTTFQNNEEAKVSKGKKNAAPKKTTLRKKEAAPATTYPETLFTAEPNPYHVPVAPYLWIDHPEQNETLYAAHYVIRLGVGGAEIVEISIDQGPWIQCRANSGYWWYDWNNAAPGPHKLVARMKTFDGAWFRTPERKISRNG